MTLYQNKYRIESTRYKGWDYSMEGSYFITICTQNRDNLFGSVKNGRMILNQFGNIAGQCWLDLPNHYQNIRLDVFVIMPNHVHGIIVIDNKLIHWDNDEYCRIKKYIIENPKHLLEN